MPEMPDPAVERALCRNVSGPVAGVDEVGRGALAGPVVAAAVVLPRDIELPGVTDSKRLSRSQRETGFDLIVAEAICWSVGVVGPDEIDQINVRQATFRAMREAVARLDTIPDLLLVDGRDDPGCGTPTETLIGGDGKSLSIAAASILAKVTRDRMMIELAADLPVYGFDRHVGYGTPFHRNAIRRFGPAYPHRRTFLGRLLQEELSFSE